MSFDMMDFWKIELDEMNKGKEGRQYQNHSRNYWDTHVYILDYHTDKPKEWYRLIVPSVFPWYQTTAPSTVESIN